MQLSNTPLRLKSSGPVLLPAATACLAVSAIALVTMASDTLSNFQLGVLLAAGGLIYAATLAFIALTKSASAHDLAVLERTDPLSQLPNRHALHQDLDDLEKSGDEVAVAMFGLDGFKQINDHFGHAQGDELIRQFACLMQELVAGEATCYRLGGDEFAAVVTGPVAGTILEGLSRKILDRLHAPVKAGLRELPIGASIGLAHSTACLPLSASEMLRRADGAMYMSKCSGKMRCTWFNTSFDQRREVVHEIEEALRFGLKNSEFDLAYQPLVDAETGHIVAVEALLRWTKSDGEEVSPTDFIPIAEDSGIINPLGLWVLREAMTRAGRWEGISLSINISAAQLRNSEFAIHLGEILEETDFPPHLLELEVTETCLVLDPQVAERSLDVIRQFGVKIALDDFGTGYASIGFLRQFRFEKLKLDRSLVVQASKDEGSRAMMLSSIAVARALNMAVTAEGVETQDQATMVRMAGCDQIQGWLYHKAMPPCEIDLLLDEQNHAASAARRDTASSPAITANAGRAR